MIGDIGVGAILRDVVGTCEFDGTTALAHNVLDPVIARSTLEVFDATAGAEHFDQFIPRLLEL